MDSGSALMDGMVPEPTSPTVFQFISDPSHKENLSGRVRAACITCRRKKIKCSGEMNCRTCQERGFVCEGLPTRKRPKRDSIGSSCVLDPLPAGVDQTRKLSASKKPSLKQRPASLLRLAKATRSEDSGYGQSPSPITSSVPRSKSPSESSSTTAQDSRTAARTSPAPFRVDIWDLGGGGGNDPVSETQNEEFPSNNRTGLSEIPPSPTAAISLSEIPPSPTTIPPIFPTNSRKPSQDSNIYWWDSTHRVVPETVDLSSAARVLFGSSAQPPLPNPPKPTIDLDGMPINNPPQESRRQTVTFPLGGGTSQFDVLANQPGIFDDMALLLAARSPEAGATTGMTEFSPWWDFNNELNSMLSQAGAALKEEVDLDLDAGPRTEESSQRKRPVVGNFYW